MRLTPSETLDDLDRLYSDMGMADETPDDVMHSVCNPTLPDAGEVWGGLLRRVASGWMKSAVRFS